MREFLKFTLRFLDYTIGRNRRIAWISVVLVAAGYAAKAGLAFAMKVLTDALAAESGPEALMALAAVIVLFVVANAEPLLTGHVGMHQYTTAALALENHLLEVDLGMPHIDHLEDPSYIDRYDLLRGDVENLCKIIWTWVRMLAASIQTILSTLLLISVHPVLVLLPTAVIPLLYADSRSAKIRDHGRLKSAPHSRLEEALTGILTTPGTAKEAKAARAELAVNELADEAWARGSSALIRTSIRAELASSAAWIVFASAQVGAAAWVGARVANGQAQLGDVILVITLGLQARQQFGTFVWNATRGMSTQLAFRRYRELIDLYERCSAPIEEPAAAPDRLDSGIRFESVAFSYPGTDRESLVDVDLHLRAGTTVAVVGENGAGKSTLVKLLCGLYEPTSGRITVDSVDLARIPPDEWRSRVAGLFQDFAKFQFTAGDAIGVGDLPSRQDHSALVAAVDRANAHSVIESLLNGYETQLGRQFEGGVDLSGGQWQRLGLAQAMMRTRPVALVLDEPASALDPFAEHDLFERYAEAAKASAQASGTVTVFVSHRFSTVLMADLIVVLDEGQVVEVGDHKQLLAKSGLYAQLYNIQRDAYSQIDQPVGNRPADPVEDRRGLAEPTS